MAHRMDRMLRGARAAFRQGDLYRAQGLLQACLRLDPCAKTYHNLGVFYVLEGRIARSGDAHDASRMGKRLLQKALTLAPLASSEQALGYLYFRQKQYGRAARCYQRAYGMAPDFAAAYNLALSYYRAHSCQKARLWAKKAGQKGDGAEKQEALILELFAALSAGENLDEEARNALLAVTDPFLLEEKFVLTFLLLGRCEARKQLDRLLGSCWVDGPVMAMVFDCLLAQGEAARVGAVLRNRLAQLRDSGYDFGREARQLKRAFRDARYRKRLIASYRFIRPLLLQQCYLE